MGDRETWYRVPRSAEECAVHLEAGGVVEYVSAGVWRPTKATPREMRASEGWLYCGLYRLVYTPPVGMSGVIGAPSHAYGLAEQAPAGWETRGYGNDEPFTTKGDAWKVAIIEARPPVPPVPPRTEMVPLTKLVGRTLVGETSPVSEVARTGGQAWHWWPAGELRRVLPVDVETGLVEVLAEGEA